MGEWATVASTLIAGIGLLFAGAQLLVMNRSAAMDRRIALEGVVVSWRRVEAPRGPEDDGTAAWLYEIRVHNPGRMPVDDVQVDWHFQCDVRRRRSGALEEPTKHVRLTTPVLAGGREHLWNRRLVMNYREAEAVLPKTFATIAFLDIDGRSQSNTWPRSARAAVQPA